MSTDVVERQESWAWAARFWALFSKHTLLFLAVCVLGVIVVAGLAAHAKDRVTTPGSMTAWAYTLALCLTLLVVFMSGVMIRIAGGRLSDLVVGADNKTSTSKFQYLLWTVGIAFALAFIAFRTFVDSKGNFICPATGEAHNCVPNDETWQQYLILMGAPAAAAVIAKATALQKSANGEVQSGDTSVAPAPGDLATNTLGRVDIVDVQYLVFNVIAFTYFAATFVNRGTFVTVPTLLLGLTSASAATYAVSKAIVANKPVIKSVSPSLVTPGGLLTIQGSNFFGSQRDGAGVRVKVAGAEAVVTQSTGGQPASQSLTVRAPQLLTGSDPSVVVVVADGTESAPYPVSVAQAAILGWVGTAPAPAADGTLKVVGRPGSAGSDEVLIAGVVHRATYDATARTLTFTVPGGLTPGATTTVTYLVDGRVTASADVVLSP